MAEPIRVVICDDQVVVTEGLRAILEAAGGIEVVGVGHDGDQALELVGRHRPDLILMDLKMPGLDGLQATRAVKAHYPEVYVLVLTTYATDEWVFDAIRAGAAGYLLKDTPRDGLIAAIKGTVAGSTHVDPAVAGKLFSHVAQVAPPPKTALFNHLTERELEILRLLARGLSNADIAARLFLSEGTVRNYVSAILSKLAVEDRTQAAVLALRHGLLSDSD